MERYPSNGRLLRIYGRFQEFVRNDPWGANRYYQEALKLGFSESLLSLSTPEQQAKMSVLGQVDEKSDGIIIIGASGEQFLASMGVREQQHACTALQGLEL